MRLGRAVNIIDVPDALGNVRRREHPSATESAKAIRFGEAVGNDEAFRIDMKSRSRLRLKQHLAINFVNQDVCSTLLRQQCDLPQHGVRNHGSARIVQVTENNEPCPRTQVALKIVEINVELL